MTNGQRLRLWRLAHVLLFATVPWGLLGVAWERFAPGGAVEALASMVAYTVFLNLCWRMSRPFDLVPA